MRKLNFDELENMTILTDEGTRLGKISEIYITLSGNVETLIVKPSSEEVVHMLPRDEDDNILVPFSSVIAIKDYVVVDEEGLKSESKESLNTEG